MWYQEQKNGVVLFLKVIPQAPKNEIVGRHGDFLKVKIKAPPQKGKANEELKRFLAKVFNTPKNNIVILKGQTQTSKIVFVLVGVEKLLEVVK